MYFNEHLLNNSKEYSELQERYLKQDKPTVISQFMRIFKSFVHQYSLFAFIFSKFDKNFIDYFLEYGYNKACSEFSLPTVRRYTIFLKELFKFKEINEDFSIFQLLGCPVQ